MDNWEKTQRQKRFRNKSRHPDGDGQDPSQRLREPRKKAPRQRIDPVTWEDDDAFYDGFAEEADEFSDSE